MKRCHGMLMAVIMFSGGAGMGVPVFSEPMPLEGKEVCVIPVGKQEVQRALFSPDGKRLLVGGHDASLLWDVPEGRKIADLRHRPVGEPSGRWNDVSFSGDGTRILTKAGRAGGYGAFCTVWDALTGAPVGKTRLLHVSVVSRACLTPNARLFLNASCGVHDVTAEGINPSLRPIPVEGVEVVCSPDSRKGVFFDSDGGVSVWDLLETKKIWSKPGQSKYNPLTVAKFSEDGSLIFVADQKGVTAEIYDLVHCRSVAKVREKGDGADDDVGIAATPFSMMCFNAETGKMWKANFPLPLMREQWKKSAAPSYRIRYSLNLPPFSEPSPGIIYVTGNGRYAVMAQLSESQMFNDEGTLLIWDAEKKEEAGKIVYWDPYIFGITASPKEHYLLFTGGNNSPEGIVNLATGRTMKAPGRILAFSADDSMIAWQDGENIRVWKLPAPDAAGR